MGLRPGQVLPFVRRWRIVVACLCAGLTLATQPSAQSAAPKKKVAPKSAVVPKASPEARLIEVYGLIGMGESRKALALAESLTRDVPNFQVAQMVYGDLLLAQHGRLSVLQAAPTDLPASSATQWSQLRQEATLRLAALTERPPSGAVPRQFVDLPPTTQHAIAVDASRSRLYVFENTVQGMKLVADHYVSLGRLGVDKKEQGDQRTPLGVYFITSRLGGAQLKDFYGPGALTLNYPNEYDRRRGKTGGGIWLHGVPQQNFARSPQSTDGCVVLANEDLTPLLREVALRRTPVVISPKLEWLSSAQAEQSRAAARHLVEQWHEARSRGDTKKLLEFYSPQFASGNADIIQWSQILDKELVSAQSRQSELKDLSILSWRDTSEVLIVTFGEVLKGQRTGPVKRQYWGKESGQWKIFFEGVIG